MGIVGCRPTSILFATEFWIERKSKLKLVFVPCTIKEIAKNPLGLFEEGVVLGHQWMLKVGRFSHIRLTIEYTDHVYCPYQNQGNAKFTLPINALSINIYSRAIPIYVVSIVSIYLHRLGSLTRHQPDYELLSHLDLVQGYRVSSLDP